MTAYTDAEIARICHEANVAIMDIDGHDEADPHWFHLPRWRRAAANAVIRTIRARRAAGETVTAESLWVEWCARKRFQGWTYGPVRDATKKEHPSLTSTYAEVPWRERVKDYAYLALIDALDGDPESDTA